MLKLIKFELLKLFSHKNIRYILILLLLICNLFVYLESINHNQSSKNYNIYRSVKNEINDMKIEDKFLYLKDKINFFDKVTEYEKNINNEFFIKDNTISYDLTFIHEYEEFTKTKEYENSEIYYAIYHDLYKYYDNLSNYHDYINQVIENGKNYQKGIFWIQAEATKKYDIINAMNQYAALKDIDLEETNTLSIDIYNRLMSPHLIAMITAILIALVVFQEDENTQLGQLQLICLQGKYKSATAKLMVIILSSAIVSVVINISSILLLQIIYGFVNSAIAIQSISTLYESPFHLSLMQYLVYIIGLKTLFLIAIVMMFCGIHKTFKKGIFSITLISIIFAVSTILFLNIDQTNILGLLKYLNLYAFLCSNHFLAEYVNGLAYYHLDITTISIIIALVLIIIFIFLYYVTYANHKRIHLNQFKLIKVHAYLKSTNLLIQEMFKNLWINKAFVFVALLMLLQGYILFNTYQSVPNYLIKNEQQVARLIEHYGGELSDKEKEIIELQYLQYEEDKNELDNQYQQYLQGEIEEESYNHYVSDYLGKTEERLIFNQVYERYTMSKDYLTYSSGFRAIFSLNTYSREIRCAILLILSIVFLSNSIINSDLLKNENCLYRITKYGRSKRLSKRIFITIILGVLLVIMYSLFELFVFNQLYPMNDWNAPLSSILSGEDNIVLLFPFSERMPIWQYYLQFLLIRLFGMMTCTIIGLWISKVCRNRTQSFIVAITIYLLPLLLYLGGLDFILSISLFDMVMSNLFIHSQFVPIKIIGYIVIDALIINYLYRKEA